MQTHKEVIIVVFIICYLMLLQLASLLSVGIICGVYFIISFLFSIDTKQWISFFSKHTNRRVCCVMLLVELISLGVVLPIAYWWLLHHPTPHGFALFLAIPILSFILLLIKIKTAIQLIQEKNSKRKPTTIYK